ncbi:MAG: HD domain-containing protein [Firmicutes bacterium]|nr:HD domain-containing protein [Bacillota bacterium]
MKDHKKSALISRFLVANQLKDVKRYSSQKRFGESVADHTYNMIFMAMELIEKYNLDLDVKNVIDLIRVHDLLEIGLAQDYESIKTNKCEILKEQKAEFEAENMQRMVEIFGNKFHELINEYEQQQTPESRFVKALDKLECCVHKMSRGLKNIESVEFDATSPHKHVANYPPLIPFWQELQGEMKVQYTNAGFNWDDKFNFKPKQGHEYQRPLEQLQWF